MAEYIESKCRDCFNLAPCAAWIKHGTMLYSDFSYSVEGCRYFVSATDVAPVVHAKWMEVPFVYFGAKRYECSNCYSDVFWNERIQHHKDKYCPNCGARMEGS